MSEIAQLAEEFAESGLRRAPTTATMLGDHRYDERMPDIGPRGREDERAALAALRERLAGIDRAALRGEDAISHHMLAIAATDGLALLDTRLDQLALDQLNGPQVSFPQLLAWLRVDTVPAAHALQARFREAFPRFMDQCRANLAEGVAAGRTAPRIVFTRVVAQLEALLVIPPADSIFGRTVAGAPAPLRDDLLAAVRDAVYPAYAGLLAYLRADYAPHVRESPGLSAIPDGAATYAFLVHQVTQSDLRPERVHAIGLEELAAIHAEMRALGVRAIGPYVAALAGDPALHFGSRAELLAAAQALYDRAWAGLPALFGRLPATPCQVIPLEESAEQDAPAAYYLPQSADGARPGTYYVNTYRPDTRPRYNLPALTAHEAVPGHHLQIALQNEAPGVPRFRRFWIGLPEPALTAFVEGWGLYSERLGSVLGLYTTDLERFGMLSYQAWRAVRLVVDTGIHALGWSRERAIRFMLDNAGLPENEAVNEIDRYIVWPGQALGYKMGQRHIEALRRHAEGTLGARFDLRAFHDELLRHGAIPLSTATLAVETWMQTVAGDHAPGADTPRT